MAHGSGADSARPLPAATAASQAKPVAGNGYQYFVTGSALDAHAAFKAGFALMGGGTDQDAAFRWMCQRAGAGDFVVLRATGDDAYDPYIKNLCPALNSVETLVISSRAGANQPFVLQKIRQAEAIFLSGGSQDNYVHFWQHTPVEEAINVSIARGVPVGGTSAGLAVLGEYSFSALNDTVRSPEALHDPFDRRVTLDRNFLRVPLLRGMITDSHFVARQRMGRLLVFLARLSGDGWRPSPYGIGIDEKTAVLVEPDGNATVTGRGAAYFLHPPGPAQHCQPGLPLTYSGVPVYRVRAGSGTFNLRFWTGSGGVAYTLSARDGAVTSSNGQVY